MVHSKGKVWEVERAAIERFGVKPEVLPALKIYLTDTFRSGPLCGF